MITKEQHEKIITDYDEFNKFMLEYTESIIQRVFLEVPQMVMLHMESIQSMKKLRDKFYNDFPDLKDHQLLLGKTVNRLSTEHPEWDKQKLFTAAGEKVQELLKEGEEINAQGF